MRTTCHPPGRQESLATLTSGGEGGGTHDQSESNKIRSLVIVLGRWASPEAWNYLDSA